MPQTLSDRDKSIL